MLTILKDPETGETICTDEPEGEGANFVAVGQTDRYPNSDEVWDEILDDWITDELAQVLRTERDWNLTCVPLRAKLFEYEARLYMLEQAVFNQGENDE